TDPAADPAGGAGGAVRLLRLFRALPRHLALRVGARPEADRHGGRRVRPDHPDPAAALAQRPGRAAIALFPEPAPAGPLHVLRPAGVPLVEGEVGLAARAAGATGAPAGCRQRRADADR